MVATRNGITTIFDREHPRLEARPYVIPLDVMAGSNDIYTFDMELDASEEQVPTLAMSASSTAERWHQRLGQRLGHVSGKTLDIPRKTAGTGVSFEGSPPACDVCKLGKSKQQSHPKTTKYLSLIHI